MEVLLNTIMLEPKRWSSPKSITIPLIELLPDIKKAGFKRMEIWGYHLWNLGEDELYSLSEKLRGEGMIAPSIGSYLTQQGGPEREGILNAARRYFSICERLGSRRLRIFYGNKDFEKSSQDYLRFIDGVYEKIFKMGKDKGIQVISEMHQGSVINSIKGLKRAIEKWRGRLDFGVVYQPYEFRTEPAIKALDVSLGYIRSVHLQNRRNNQFTGLAEGDVDYQRILRKLASSGYDGPFVLEFTTGIVSPIEDFDYRCVLTSAAQDREWLKSMWRKINEQTQVRA